MKSLVQILNKDIYEVKQHIKDSIYSFQYEYQLLDTDIDILYNNAEKIIDRACSDFGIRNNDYDRITNLMAYTYATYFTLVSNSLEQGVQQIIAEVGVNCDYKLTPIEIEPYELDNYMCQLFPHLEKENIMTKILLNLNATCDK